MALFTLSFEIHLRWSKHNWSAQTDHHSHLEVEWVLNVSTVTTCDHLKGDVSMLLYVNKIQNSKKQSTKSLHTVFSKNILYLVNVF